jgi:hypothetical protein
MDLKELGFEAVECIHLGQVRDQWWEVWNVGLNLEIP